MAQDADVNRLPRSDRLTEQVAFPGAALYIACEDCGVWTGPRQQTHIEEISNEANGRVKDSRRAGRAGR